MDRLNFQSHYGLILSPNATVRVECEQSAFNPTMVWFYLCYDVEQIVGEEIAFNPTMVWFYLIKSLKEQINEVKANAFAAFNPTMVWFYQFLNNVKVVFEGLFQSHYGLILSYNNFVVVVLNVN